MVPEHSAMLIVAVVLVITHLGLAVLMATVTARAAAGRLPPRNQWVGIRTPRPRCVARQHGSPDIGPRGG